VADRLADLEVETDLRGPDLASLQKMHGEATETKVSAGPDWVADVPVSGVALFVSKAIDSHRQKLNAIPEIVIDVWRHSPVGQNDRPFGLASAFRSNAD